MASQTDKGFSTPSGVPDSSRPAVASNYDEWNAAIPKSVGFADAVSDKENKSIWEKIYRNAGMSSANEKERKAVRAAVYVYCCKNGSSREGEYSEPITLANGTEIEAAIIPRSAGRMKIRKFLRANMNESYAFFKNTKCMETDDRFVAKAAKFGISPENAFAVADWMDDCPFFTPAEGKAHDTSFVKGIERARRARGGHSLEEVENGRVDDEIKANGPAVAGMNGGAVDY